MESDPQAFEGTAEHYFLGRPPYSDQLFDALAQELGLDGTGQLLDVGCGPGVLELILAPLFERMVALDREVGMLHVGQRRCQQAGITNVRWVNDDAEQLGRLDIGPCRAVTFGQSMHWLEQRPVIETVYDLLVPGGALILVSHHVDGRPRPANPGSPPIPHDAVRELIRAYLGDGTAGEKNARGSASQPARFAETLRQSRFGGSRIVYLPGRPDLIRDIDAVVANFLSMSFAAPRLFGTRRAAFEADLRRLLREHSPDGRFWDWPGDTELLIATR